MGWDATLYERLPIRSGSITTDSGCHQVTGAAVAVGSWNFTRNCNVMIWCALARTGQDVIDLAYWWDALSGLEGPAGAALLHEVIRELEADPGLFQAMNPKNGWGSYDSLLEVLREMRAAVPERPCFWSVTG